MKQLLLILLTAFLLGSLVACGGDSVEIPETTPNPPIPPEYANEIVMSDDANLSPIVSQDGGTTTIQFTTNERWTAYVSDTRAVSDWLSVYPTSGDSGNVSITITTKRNETPNDREGYVKIQSGQSQAIVSITQKQRDALTVSPSKEILDARETDFDIEVRANIDFEVDVRADWIEQIYTRAMTTTHLTFRAKRNIGDERTGTIIIRSGEKSETITITQEKGDFIVDTGSFNVSASQQSISAKVRANIEFEVKPQVTWIHFNNTRAMTSYNLDLEIDENTTGEERTGKVIVSSNGKTETITVVQSNEAFDVQFDKTDVPNEGGTITATVNSNMEYDIEIDEVDWIARVDTRAITPRSHNFKIEPNPKFEKRTATIKFVYQSEKGEATKQIIITQQSSDIVANKSLYELDANGGLIDVTVQGNTNSSSNIEYYITKGVEWISRTETRAATVDFTFNVDKNTTGKQREGEIEFTLPDKTNTKVKIIQSATIDFVKIPDENLKAYMVNNFDKNGDGEISKDEATYIKYVNCSDMGIESLEGIEELINLQSLYCSLNKLSSIDISKNTALKSFSFTSSESDDSRNNPLEYLNLGDFPISQLSFIDFRIGVYQRGLLGRSKKLKVISSNLTSLDVAGNYMLESLDVSECPQLKEIKYEDYITSWNLGDLKIASFVLYKGYGYTKDYGNYLMIGNVCGRISTNRIKVYGTQIKTIAIGGISDVESIDVSGCSSLISLDVPKGIGLIELNVNGCSALAHLSCSGQQLMNLDVSSCTALTWLDCSGNLLTSLDVSKNALLSELCCFDNRLTSLNIGSYASLTRLRCQNNKLEKLSLDGCTALTTLLCHNNQLSSLNVSGCVGLTYLPCYNNQLINLDISGCTGIEELECYNNKLVNLDVSDCIALTKLSCHDNLLTDLNIRGCTALNSLSCYNNKLTSLDVSECADLVYFPCHDNQLITLNISGCVSLPQLSCYNNQLISLDVSENLALTKLECYSNQLVNLDVRANKALTKIDCRDNLLMSLDVSENTALESLDCNKNPLEILNIGNFDVLSMYFTNGGLKTSANFKIISSKITNLMVDDNKLQSLDVSGCPSLTELDCSNNLLVDLDVSNNIALTKLNCSDNRLINLDLTKTNMGYYDSEEYYTSTIMNPKYLHWPKDKPFPPNITDLYITTTHYYYPLRCSGMSTLQILYLRTGWSIRGVNYNRSTDYIPTQTNIIYKD